MEENKVYCYGNLIKRYLVIFDVGNGIVDDTVAYTVVDEGNIDHVANTVAGISDDGEVEETSEINKKGKLNLNKVVFIVTDFEKINQLNILYLNLELVRFKKDLILDKLTVIKIVKEVTGDNSKNFSVDPISKPNNVENIEGNSLVIYHS